MSEVKCWVESQEASAESNYHDATKGLKRGEFKCGCGKIVPESSLESISPNPWAMPVCRDCADSHFKQEPENERG